VTSETHMTDRETLSQLNDLLGLDVSLEHPHGAGRAFGWPGTRAEHRRCALVVEFSAHEPKLREYSSARRGRSVLLLRALSGALIRSLVIANAGIRFVWFTAR